VRSVFVGVLDLLELLLEVVTLVLEVDNLGSPLDNLREGFIEQVKIFSDHHVDYLLILRADDLEHIIQV
jgi:hypothetical protein